MDVLKIEESSKNPRVLLDPNEKYMLLEGRSIVPNPVEFYDPILEWLTEYKEGTPFPLKFDFKMEYFNTASHKMIMQLFLLLKEANEKGAELDISWHHYEYDDDMLEVGEEIELLTGLKFEYIEMDGDE